ncbi:serine/threonine protein kinase [Ignisphaera aggregans DSM 17230]|uniref:Serine/threonine protein kinase n=1 Tax=Ignisphaera aggregans (strain DSM 17230 / JCM 13409 / AQ1.S1) TaxID=583356 RepID=E0STM1_IGNAA|nr:serine/threonine protein kinase [Ignisphaera aggregans DSM 17230]
MNVNTSIPIYVESRILFNEKTKRPQLYREALKTVLENTDLVNIQILRTISDKKFLRTVFGEAIARKPKLQAKLISENILSGGKDFARYLGFSNLRIYSKIIRNESVETLKITSEDDLFRVEENLRYNVPSNSIETAKTIFINRLLFLGDENDIGIRLSRILNLAHEPSVYMLKGIDRAKIVVMWPYIIVSRVGEGVCEVRLLGENIVEVIHMDQLLDKDDIEVELKPIDDWIFMILSRDGSEYKASIYRLDPNGNGVIKKIFLRGISIVYSKISKLFYVFDASEGNPQIRVYDLDGMLVASKDISRVVNLSSTSTVHGYECSSGVLFIIRGDKSSQVLYYDYISGTLLPKPFASHISNALLLPLHILILYSTTKKELLLFDILTGEDVGKYQLPISLNNVFLALGGGIIGFADNKIYILDALGNIYKSIEMKDYDRYSVLNTYLYSLISLYRMDRIEKIIVFYDDQALEVDMHRVLHDDVIDIQYNNSTLYLITKHYVLALSPSIFLSYITQLKNHSEITIDTTYTHLCRIEELLGQLHIQLNNLKHPRLNLLSTHLLERHLKVLIFDKQSITALDLFLEELINIIGGFKALHKNEYMLRNIIERSGDVINYSCASFAATLTRIEDFINNIHTSTTLENYMRNIIRVLPINEFIDLGELLRSWFDTTTIRNIRGALVYIIKEPRYVYAKDDAYAILKSLGFDIQYVEDKVKSLLKELEKFVDRDIVERLEVLFRDALYQGDAELIHRSMTSISKFLEYLHEKLLLVEKNWKLNLLTYTDIKSFVNRCVIELALDEKKMKICREELESYVQKLSKLHEELEELRTLIDKSHYVKIDPLKYIGETRNLNDSYNKLISLVEKVKRAMELEDRFRHLLTAIETLRYKPSLETYVKMCVDFLRELRCDEADQCLKSLQGEIDRINRINSGIDRMRLVSDCPMVVAEIDDVIDKIKLNRLEEAQNKIKGLESALDVYISLKVLIENTVSNLEKIGIDKNIAIDLGNKLKCHIINEVYSDKTKVDVIPHMIRNLATELTRITAKVNEVSKIIESATSYLNRIGIDSEIEWLKKSFWSLIEEIALETIRICGETPYSCVDAVKDFSKKVDNVRGAVVDITDSLRKLSISFTPYTDASSQIYTYIVIESLKPCRQQNLFNFAQCIKEDVDSILAKREAIAVLLQVEKLVNSFETRSYIGRRILTHVRELIRQEMSKIVSVKIDVKNLVEVYRDLLKRIGNLISILNELDRICYELESYGVNMLGILFGSSKELDKLDIENIQRILYSSLQNLKELYTKHWDPELLGLVLSKFMRIDHTVLTFLELLFELLSWFNIEKKHMVYILRAHSEEADPEKYIERVLHDLALFIVREKLEIEVSSKLEEQAAIHLMFIDYVGLEEHREPLSCNDIDELKKIEGFAIKAVDSYCMEKDIGKAAIYSLLSYTVREEHFPILFRLLGGIHKNMLIQSIKQLSKYIDVKGFRHLVLWRCLSKPFTEGRYREIGGCIYNLQHISQNIRKVSEILSSIQKIVDKANISKYILDILFEIRELIADPVKLLENYSERYIKIEVLEPIDPSKEKSELVLRITNRGSLPITIRRINASVYSIVIGSYTRDLIVKPRSSEIVKITISRIPSNIPSINEAYIDLPIQGDFYIVEPSYGSTSFSYTLILPLNIPPYKQALRKLYDTVKRSLSRSIDLDDDLEKSFIATGRYNVVLRGRIRETNEDVVIKIPIIVLEMETKLGTYTIPTLHQEEYNWLDRRRREYIDASRECRDVVPIYEISIEPPYYIVEKYIEGKTLRRWLEDRKTVNPSEALRIVHEVGKTIKCLHKYNIYHNDIRPDNIIITVDGRIILIDIGADEIFRWLFKRYYDYGRTREGRRALEHEIEERYIADLEQELRSATDINTESMLRRYLDLYQLVVLLYELLTGSNPHLTKTYEYIPSLSEKLNNFIRAILLGELRDPSALDEFIKLLEVV